MKVNVQVGPEYEHTISIEQHRDSQMRLDLLPYTLSIESNGEKLEVPLTLGEFEQLLAALSIFDR